MREKRLASARPRPTSSSASRTRAAISAVAEAVYRQGLGDDVGNRQPRIERGIGVLEDRLHVLADAPQRITAEVRDVAAHEFDAAGLDIDQPQQAARQSGLATKPDSPTIPSVSPRWIDSETPSTAWT